MAITFYLRGGYKRLLVWDPATGTTVDTSLVRSGADIADTYEPAVMTDGTSRQVGRSRELAAEVASWTALEQLRTWASAGTSVRAILVALGRGLHGQWDESVPPLLGGISNAFGQLGGDVLRLTSAAVDADVFRSPDLMQPFVGAWDGSEDRVLPAPGLTVYGKDHTGADDVTLSAHNFAGTIIGSAVGPSATPSLVLPAGTYAVRVACATRPTLTTRPV